MPLQIHLLELHADNNNIAACMLGVFCSHNEVAIDGYNATAAITAA